ncbi:legumain-like [Pseudorasbora parva]|uniref:legumain-like n=1 Tax=Pseudorasbora parva TaxID=51549 RepID=UPI00351DAC5D
MTGLGNKGTFEFPDKSLHKDDLIRSINSMRQKQTFSKMVIFMTSSYSATMFQDLSKDINVYALTACDKDTKSVPSDFDTTRKVYLSDKFSSTLLKCIHKFF